MDINNFRVNDLMNTTTVRRGVAIGQPIAIETCKNSNILVLDRTATVTIDDCTDCFVVLAPCSGSSVKLILEQFSVFLRECQHCTVLVACQQLRTRDCHTIRIASHCITQPIIEETSDIVFHPLTLHYDTFVGDMIAANLSIFTSCTASVHDFTAEKGTLHCRISNEVLPLSSEQVAVLNKHGVSADRQDSDIPLYESRISPSYYYYIGYSKDVPLRQFIEQCLKVVRAVSSSPCLRLVSTFEVDVDNRVMTSIDKMYKDLSTLVVIEVCGREDDIEQLMSTNEICFKKIPEEQQEYFASEISHNNKSRMA
ncbi:tubulin binding cofactor [Dictyocaulus viviparus]|uniref:Tubulin binding cofactor n=1 Tax=Dictyocaulus viviparus TaxID=29172 RepID=A0A0D8YDU4_DICVI|nr:tubulin binding cofactor [Dictyocaulus viviparus]